MATYFDHDLTVLVSDCVQLEAAPSKDDLRHFHMHFMDSPEKRTILLHQFQALKERLKSESKNMHPYQGKFLRRQTVELFKTMCNKFGLGANHIIRLRALEIYDRFMSLLNGEILIAARSHKYSPEDINKINARIESQTLLRICSCIQLAYKFHYDKDDQVLTIKDIQNVLNSYALPFTPAAIKRSENRVYRTMSFKLNFVTTLDIIEHIIPLTNTHIEDTPKIYHLCIKLLDFVYLSHDQIYKRVKNQKISPCKSLESNQSPEFNLILRSAGILTCAFCLFWPNSDQEKARMIAEICCLPEQNILALSSIIFNELILN